MRLFARNYFSMSFFNWIDEILESERILPKWEYDKTATLKYKYIPGKLGVIMRPFINTFLFGMTRNPITIIKRSWVKQQIIIPLGLGREIKLGPLASKFATVIWLTAYTSAISALFETITQQLANKVLMAGEEYQRDTWGYTYDLIKSDAGFWEMFWQKFDMNPYPPILPYETLKRLGLGESSWYEYFGFEQSAAQYYFSKLFYAEGVDSFKNNVKEANEDLEKRLKQLEEESKTADIKKIEQKEIDLMKNRILAMSNIAYKDNPLYIDPEKAKKITSNIQTVEGLDQQWKYKVRKTLEDINSGNSNMTVDQFYTKYINNTDKNFDKNFTSDIVVNAKSKKYKLIPVNGGVIKYLIPDYEILNKEITPENPLNYEIERRDLKYLDI
jgi:hypothetical protein